MVCAFFIAHLINLSLMQSHKYFCLFLFLDMVLILTFKSVIHFELTFCLFVCFQMDFIYYLAVPGLHCGTGSSLQCFSSCGTRLSCPVACGILVPWPGTKPRPPALGAQGLRDRTTLGSPWVNFCIWYEVRFWDWCFYTQIINCWKVTLTSLLKINWLY